MLKKYRCSDCDDDRVLGNSNLQSKPLCMMCGSELVLVPNAESTPSPLTAEEERMRSMEGLFELLGSDLRDAIMESMSQSRPSRQISVSYLSTLGKVVVDSRKSILRDVYLCIGPLNILAVSASFGFLPNEGETASISANIVCSSPICGESALTNHAECSGAMVVLQRGVVSFANKSMRAAQAGAVAVIVSQTAGVWPFVMADSAGELKQSIVASSGKDDTVTTSAGVTGGITSIPVVMISQKDADIIQKWIAEQPQEGKRSISSGGNNTGSSGESRVAATAAALKFGHSVHECSICQEAFEVGATVLKLPCRHVYHCECVTSWLAQNNTCPLCRLELPKEAEGRALPGRNNAGGGAAATAAQANSNGSPDIYNH